MLMFEVQGGNCAGASRWPLMTDDTSYDMPAGEPATTVGPLGDQLHQHYIRAGPPMAVGISLSSVGDALCRLI